jgi:hypothetical protein
MKERSGWRMADSQTRLSRGDDLIRTHLIASASRELPMTCSVAVSDLLEGR